MTSLGRQEQAPHIAHVADKLGLMDASREAFMAAAQVHRFPHGMTVIQPGGPAQAYLYVIGGAVRMQLVGANGRAVTLLRIEADEPCVITTSCLFSHKPYPVEGVTEGEVTALTIPARTFDVLFAQDSAFRAAVLATFSTRVGEIILAMESSLFEPVPARLARALLAAGREGVVNATHAELASEIGSAREVVSRQLSRFAEKGLIALERGKIILKDRVALAREDIE
ncbi:MAG: Crp/Fnr family transcriptional regulator [Proteobacteria bacterium]|nr:Crp/Fnr family transcriptional regulator [Pseudomonadota bacterium]